MMTKFIELDGYGRIKSERDIDQDDLKRCPHAILMPQHYRDDGRCRCDDPTHKIMIEWGYVWDGSKWESAEG